MPEHSRGSTEATLVDQSLDRASPSEPSAGELMKHLSEQSTALIKSELQLAQLEMSEKAKRAGLGVGLFGGAGVVALYGVGATIATVILGLVALGLAPWLSALIVTAVLFLIASIVALVGKKQLSKATPMSPATTIDSVKQDIDTVKEARQS